MSDEFLVEEDDGVGALVRADGSERPTVAELRGSPLFVEPVAVQMPADTAIDLGVLRTSLVEEYGFAPREIHRVDAGVGGWRLLVDGEEVERGDDVAGLRVGVARHLHRMLGTDDLIDLLAYARLEAPVTTDGVIPHRIGLTLLRGVLSRLLRDDLPIKPLARIIEVLGTAPHELRDANELAARVRLARRRSVLARARQDDGALRVLELAPGAEHACRVLAPRGGLIDEERLPRLTERLRVDLTTHSGLAPLVVACDGGVHADVASVLRRVDPAVRVISRAEIASEPTSRVGVLGAGIRVAEREAPATQRTSGIWSGPSNQVDLCIEGHLEHVVDVEVIE